MAFEVRYLEALINTQGDTLPGYYARLVNVNSNQVVPLATDSAGTPIVIESGINNAAKSDDAGNLDFWVSPGIYHLDVYGKDGNTFIRRFDNIPMIPNGEAVLTQVQATAAQIEATKTVFLEAASQATELVENGVERARAWAEGIAPGGAGTESARQAAGRANASAVVASNAEAGAKVERISAAVATARSEEILTAVQQAAAGGPVLPAGQRIHVGDLGTADLKALPQDTPLGSIFIMARPGLEGAWQVRAGDYTAAVAADPFCALTVKMDAWPASQRAVVRLPIGNLYRFSWLGVNAATADVLPMLKSGFALFPGSSKWELLAGRLPFPSNAEPVLFMEKPDTHLYGFGAATHLDVTTQLQAYPNGNGLIQIAASGCRVSDMRISLTDFNNSAGNPAVIAVAPRQSTVDALDALPDLRDATIQRIQFDRTSTGIIVAAYRKTNGSEFLRPRNVLIEDIEGSSNGAAISLFGVEGCEVRNTHFRHAADRPSNSPAAKKCTHRILGSHDVLYTGTNVSEGYPTVFNLDAAYFGVRAKNRNVSISGKLVVRDTRYVFDVFECEGAFSVTADVDAKRPLASTDDGNGAFVFRILDNLFLSTIPSSAPESDKYTTVDDVTIRGGRYEGFPVFMVTSGTPGHLVVEDNDFVGNSNSSPGAGLSGIITGSGVFASASIQHNSFNAWVDPVNVFAVDIAVQPGGLAVIRDNLLPERSAAPISVARGAVVMTDGEEQRPFNGRVNLGSNSLYPIGALRNRLEGTPIPPKAAPAVAPWTRNLINQTEGPTGVFTKTGGANDTYDDVVYSTERYTGDVELIYRLRQKSAGLFVGLDALYQAPGIGSMTHAIAYTQMGLTSFYWENGGQVAGLPAYDETTVERLVRQGRWLRFYRGGVLMLERIVDPAPALGLQASIARLNDSVEILRFAAI